MIDTAGTSYIVYFDDTNDRMKYVHGTYSNWAQPYPIDGIWMGLYASIKLDNNQNPHVVHLDRADFIRYGYLSANEWYFEPAIESDTSGKISLFIDRLGKSHILYFDKGFSDLIYLKPIGNRWEKKYVTSIDDSGYSFPLVVDTAGIVHICFYDNNQGLVYARYEGNSWVFEVIDDGNKAGMYTDMVLDKEGNLYISYYDGLNQDLKYIYQANNAWEPFQVIDTAGDVGTFSSIAVDQHGSVHIGYYDNSNSALKYAYGDKFGWATVTIDDENDTGKFLSLALDKNGLPNISYYDDTLGDLKYAKANLKE